MKNLFHPNSPAMVFLTRVADLMILNVIYLLTCLPILTIGASATALYRVMLNFENKEDSKPMRQFFTAFKENFKPATILWLIMLIPVVIMLYYLLLLASGIYADAFVFVVLFALSALLVMMVWSFLWPLQAQFQNTVMGTLKNAVMFALTYFPTAIIMSLLNALPLLLMFFLPSAFFTVSPLWILLGFSLTAWINTTIVVKIFSKYMPEDSQAN